MDGSSVCPAYFNMIIMKEKKIKIKIFAVVSRGEGDEAEREKIRITGNGVMACEGSLIEIRYDEILGEDGPAVNTLSFDTGDRSVVTLVREGAVSSVMTFSEKARYGGRLFYHILPPFVKWILNFFSFF